MVQPSFRYAMFLYTTFLYTVDSPYYELFGTREICLLLYWNLLYRVAQKECNDFDP